MTGMAQGAYSETKLSGLKGAADRPQVIQVDDNRFVAIGEAALVDYSRMKLERVRLDLGYNLFCRERSIWIWPAIDLPGAM